jgi:hypothetical protein
MGQICTKLAKINRFSNFFDNLSHFLGRWTHPRQFWTNTIKNETLKKNRTIPFLDNFSHILWTKNHVLKKVGRTRAGELFKFWYFLNLHALGYPKSVTKKFCAHFWVNKFFSMMCAVTSEASCSGVLSMVSTKSRQLQWGQKSVIFLPKKARKFNGGQNEFF